MSSLPYVEVLLATYNGALFLREQIDSLLAQDYPAMGILARDDGSTDGTVEILLEYATRYPDRFRVMPASRGTGSPKMNFLLLLQAATAQYICFCDQDDVWLPDKISKTRQVMSDMEQRWSKEAPLLVFTDLRLVNDRLETLHESFWRYMGIDPLRTDQLARMMVQSVVTGCTMMINQSMQALAIRMPEQAYMHDWWISWLAAFMGKAGFVSTPTVLYRQHANNVVGTGRGSGASETPLPQRSLWAKIRHPMIAPAQLTRWRLSQQQAEAFLQTHGAELSRSHVSLLRAFLRSQNDPSPAVRAFTFLRRGFYTVGVKPNLAMMRYLWMTQPEEHAPRT